MPTDLLSGVGQAATAKGSALGNLLDAQRWGVAKALTGETDPNKQREAERGALRLSGIYPSLPHPVRGLLDSTLDTATDPLTYEMLGAGVVRRGAVKAAEAAAPFVKAGIERAPAALREFVGDVGDVGAGLQKWMTKRTAPGGKAVGELEQAHGRQARDLLLGATAKHTSREAELGERLTKRFSQATSALTEDEKFNVYGALKGDRSEAELTPKEKTAYGNLRTLSDEAAFLEADPGLRARISLRHGGLQGAPRGKTIVASQAEKPPAKDEMTAFLDEFAEKPTSPADHRVPFRAASKRIAPIQPMEMSPGLQEFVGPPGSHTIKNFRSKYLPAPHAATQDELRSTFEYNPLNWENPNLNPQPPITLDKTELAKFDEAWQRMLKNAARETTRNALSDELTAKGLNPNDPLVSQALSQRVRAKGAARKWYEKGEDIYKGGLKYGRAAQVGFTPFHGVNILALQLAHGARTVPEAASTAIKALLPGADRYKLFEQGRELGALSPSEAKIGALAGVPLAVRVGGGAALGAASGYNADKEASPGGKIKRAALGAVIGAGAGAAAPKWSQAMTHGVFTYDDAAKQALAKAYAKRGVGGGGYGAGRQAAEDLIDYANRSELGNALSWISKFPTYRSQLPGSVARAVAKNPAKIEAINRATGGVFAGGQTQTPIGPVKSYSSVADVGRGVGDPKGYIRSTLGDPVKLGIGIAQKLNLLPQTQKKFYFTYGLDPTSRKALVSAALAGIPEARDVLNEMGQGIFPSSPARDALFQFTTLGVGK